MPIIRPAGYGREPVMAGWGVVPLWLKPDQPGKQPYSTINARDDRVQTAPTYREPFKKRRCLVTATGWYEWQKVTPNVKRPFHFQPRTRPFAFAGGVLQESQFEDWMRGPPEQAAEMMKPCGGAIDIWEVGKEAGNVCNNEPELLDRVALIQHIRARTAAL